MDEIDEHRKQLKDWLDRYKNLSDIYPYVVDSYELANFKKRVADSVPDDLDGPFKVKIFDAITNGIDYFKENLPKIPDNTFIAPSGVSMAISGASGSIAVVNEIQTFGDPKFSAWTSEMVTEYNEIQRHQHREDFITTTLTAFDPKTAEEFELSVIANDKYRNALTSQSDVGIICRNVLEHLKGTLFQKALSYIKVKKPSKQKVNWAEMVEELAIGGSGSPEYVQLQVELATHQLLHTNLTHTAKNITKETQSSVQANFSIYLDHLFNVLNLIDKSKL